jgi:hypothetical protein
MSTTGRATAATHNSGPFDEPGRAESAGYRATGAAMTRDATHPASEEDALRQPREH